MTNLTQLQQLFQNYIFNNHPKFQHFIKETPTASAAERLEIYRYAYHAHLIEALSAHFPILQIYLGTERFEQLGLAYLANSPSSYRSIRWFGDKLPHFLATHPDYHDAPYLAELAEFEWTQTLVFDAKDSAILTIDTMQQIPPAQWSMLQFTFHPSLHRLNLTWNVLDIWQALSEEHNPPEPTTQTTKLILWRNALINQFQTLADDEAWMIDAMINHSNFGDICEGLCQWHPEETAALRGASLLKQGIIAGLFEKVWDE